MTPGYINDNLKNGNLILVSARTIFPKSPLAVAFRTAKWENSGTLVPEWAMCIKCNMWLKAPCEQGTNVLKSHMDKCKVDGCLFINPPDLATLIGNCLRLGGFKIKTEDLRNSLGRYPKIKRDNL